VTDNIQLSRVIALAETAISTPLKQVYKLAPQNHTDADAITAFKCHNAPEGDVFPLGREWTLAQHVFQRLGHLFANPSKSEECDALLRSYTYFETQGLPGAKDREDIANFSQLSAQAFVAKVVAAAKLHRQIRAQGATFQEQEVTKGFILHGPRGIGKTFFYNYLISHFDEYLDENASIWVRLNLADPLYDADSSTFGIANLMDWIYAQTAKIVLRYYDPKSEYIRPGKKIHFQKLSPFEALSQHVLSIDPSAKLKLNKIRNAFMRRGHDTILSSSLIPNEYSDFLFNYAQTEGYSIVIIFDGLDVLETTYNWIGKFRRIFNAVRAICRSDDLLGTAFISIMRTNSLQQEGNPYAAGVVPVFEIMAPKLEDIVTRRVAHIKREVPNLARSTYPNWNNDELFSGWPGHMDDFIGFLYPETENAEEDREEGTLLENIMESDRRAQMQAIKLRYIEFLGRRAEPRYRLMETLMKAGMAYPPVHYRYQVVGKKLQRIPGDQIRGDLRFFPSVFRVPYISESPRSDFKLSTEAMLVGIRLLQIVDAHDALKRRQLGHTPLQVDHLIHLASVLFNCPRPAVLNLVEEYIEFQLLRTFGRFSSHTQAIVTDDVSLMAKGKYLLSSAIHDIAYLNLAGMRMVLDSAAFRPEDRPFIRAARFDPTLHDGLEKWVLAKVLNSISVCRMVKEINESQRKDFNKRISSLKLAEKPLYDGIVRQLLSDNIFDKLDAMAPRILGRIEALLRSIALPTNQYNMDLVEEGFLRYVQKWCG
jgi:hypothetical protein